MNPADAETLAERLMMEFELDGWAFRWSRSVTAFGTCKRSTDGRVRVIALSRPLTVANDAAAVENTLRHEIAHALAPLRAGHGPAWRAACAITGATPERCCGDDVNAVPAPWAWHCPACGAQGSRYRRAQRPMMHCRADAPLRWERVA